MEMIESHEQVNRRHDWHGRTLAVVIHGLDIYLIHSLIQGMY